MKLPSTFRASTFRAGAVLLLACLEWSGPGPIDLHAQAGDQDLVAVELSTVGFDRAAGAPIVLLRDPESGKVLPIWVGAAEAQAIALALHGIAMPRPMTHDLMANLLAELKAEVEEIVVHDLRDNTYFGTIRLRVPGDAKLREVDSRPSDAMALALRTGAGIRVARRILDAAPPFDFVAPEGPNQIVQVLGIAVVAVTPALREEFKLGSRSGVLVSSVFGPAKDRGLQRGDLIVEVSGKSVEEPIAFFEAIRATAPGDPVRITYWRGSTRHEIEIPAEIPPRELKPGRRVLA